MVMMTREDIAAHKARIDAENSVNYYEVAGVMKGGQYRFLVQEMKMLYGEADTARRAVSQ